MIADLERPPSPRPGAPSHPGPAAPATGPPGGSPRAASARRRADPCRSRCPSRHDSDGSMPARRGAALRRRRPRSGAAAAPAPRPWSHSPSLVGTPGLGQPIGMTPRPTTMPPRPSPPGPPAQTIAHPRRLTNLLITVMTACGLGSIIEIVEARRHALTPVIPARHVREEARALTEEKTVAAHRGAKPPAGYRSAGGLDPGRWGDPGLVLVARHGAGQSAPAGHPRLRRPRLADRGEGREGPAQDTPRRRRGACGSWPDPCFARAATNPPWRSRRGWRTTS